jgi:hypothetical protein
MNNLRMFKQKLSVVNKLLGKKDYDAALVELESMLGSWPGNPRLHIIWASLVQLQDNPNHDLEEVKESLHQAIELDKEAPAASIELGYYLDNVEDDPHAAVKAFADGVASARQLLIEGLIGQAKVFRQLEKREEFLHCLLEILHLAQFESEPKKIKTKQTGADIIFESPKGHFHAIQLKGPYAGQIEDLLGELPAKRSAS